MAPDPTQNVPDGPTYDERAASWRTFALQWGLVLLGILGIEVATTVAPNPAPPIDSDARIYPPTRVPTLDESLIQWQIERLTENDADVVLFGDSSALMGLNPAVFEEVTGAATQNFGTVVWLTSEGHADTLELFIQRNGAPRLALYHMGTALHGLGATGVQRSQGHRAQLLQTFREWTGAGDVDRQIPLPSLTLRPHARALMEGQSYDPIYTAAARNHAWPDLRIRRHLDETHGQYIDLNPTPPDAWESIEPVDVHYDPGIEPGFLRMFELAEEHGFLLLVVHNPIPAVYRSEERTELYERVGGQLSELAEPYQGVHIIGPFGRYAPTSAFANYEHLNPEGAQQHSMQLAQLVQAALSGGAN